MTKLLQNTAVAVAACLLGVVPFSMTGCDQDREVLDVETPEGELEVEEDTDTGALEVETEE